VGWSAVAAAGGAHGFPGALSSVIGRAGPVRGVAGLVEPRLVAGPDGSKAGLAGVTSTMALRHDVTSCSAGRTKDHG